MKLIGTIIYLGDGLIYPDIEGGIYQSGALLSPL
jgi:hypothetical protein